MSKVYSDADGEFLVRLARNTVDEVVVSGSKPKPPDDTPAHLRNESGVFVTLNSLARGKVALRGCIGRPYPMQPLIEATIDSAVDSATRDPRFDRVTAEELDSILIELSVLTPPIKLEYSTNAELLDLVQVGRDGLIASQGIRRGLLLPQVPVNWGWDTLTYLEHTCNKAGLPANAWKDSETEFMAFQAEIFGEENPRGNIIRDPGHPRC
ncbi:MAG: AmmeMemoRadiSam system protein A [Candidatus Thorarchaeota archaeon]